MKLQNTFFINTKKLKEKTGKALYLIVPIAILVTLSIVTSSQVLNFKNAVDQSVFATIDEQARLITLAKPEIERIPGMPRLDTAADTNLTDNDLITIDSIDSVESASLNSNIAISNISTSDLFDDKITFNALTELDANAATLYTEEPFTYTKGEVVPIIINAFSLATRYEDWGDASEFTLDFRAARDNGEDINSLTPVKIKALDYDKDDLIGQEFTIDFGGLDEIETYTSARDLGVITLKKLTDEEISTNKAERDGTISEYWDIDELNTPISKTFVIVGVIEDESITANYIPTEFASTIMTEYIQKQLDAQTGVQIPVDLLNTTFTGLTYDGLELESAGSQIGGGEPGGMRALFGSNESTESYSIPGLVVELSDDGYDQVVGIYENTDVYNEAIKYGETISILVDSIYSRQNVIDQLNELGYAYQDISNLSIFDTLQSTLEQITFWSTISFIILLSGVIIFALGKFVSDSKKEIGIFRAIGVTKAGIVKLFVTQSILYSLVGYLFGVGFGYLLNSLSAGFMSRWFDNLVGNTIKETYGVVISADIDVFRQLDIISLIIFSVILLVITLLISLIPALKASNISPVEAIKGE